MCEQACMATPKGKYDTELLKYQRAIMDDSKGKYYTEFCNTITNFNYYYNTPLSNVKIQEAVFIVMREDEKGEITEANNFTADVCSLSSSLQRNNSNTIFASEKLENSDNKVDAVKNMTINNVGYELNTATASDAQIYFASNPDKSTHTSNGDNYQTLLSIRTISICHEDISGLSLHTDPKISSNNQPAFLISTVVVQAPQALQLEVVQEIVTNSATYRTGPNRTPQKVSKTCVDVSHASTEYMVINRFY